MPHFSIYEVHLLRKMYGTLLVLPKIGGMAKKKIPGQIRFLPELDCISLKGVKQHFGSLCEDINFLYTIGQRFFQVGCGGPVKVYWFGSCTKKMGQVEQDRCTGGRHLYFSSSDFVFL